MQKTTDENYVLIEHDMEDDAVWAYIFKNKPTAKEIALTILDNYSYNTMEDLLNKNDDEISEIFYEEFGMDYKNFNRLLEDYSIVECQNYNYTLICVNHINNKGVIR